MNSYEEKLKFVITANDLRIGGLYKFHFVPYVDSIMIYEESFFTNEQFINPEFYKYSGEQEFAILDIKQKQSKLFDRTSYLLKILLIEENKTCSLLIRFDVDSVKKRIIIL